MARWSLLDRNDPTAVDEGPVEGLPQPAVAIVDEALSTFVGRALVSGDEVVDRLLDLRSALVAATLLRELDERELALDPKRDAALTR